MDRRDKPLVVEDYDQEQFEREHADEMEEARYWITDAGRRAIAEAWLFE
jgi:hypothetical protein